MAPAHRGAAAVIAGEGRPASVGAFSALTAAVGLLVLGQIVAGALDASRLAVVLLLSYAAAVTVFVLRGPSMALFVVLIAFPLVTIEIGFGDVDRTVSGDKIALGLLVGGWLVARARRASLGVPRCGPVLAWGLFGGAVLLSALANASTAEAIGLIKLALMAGVFGLAVGTLAGRPELRWQALVAVSMAAGVVATLAVVERVLWLAGSWTPLYFKHGTMMDPYLYKTNRWIEIGGAAMFGSTFAQKNFLAAYLVLLLPPTVALALRMARSWRTGFWVIAGCLLMGLAAASSVGAWVGLAASASVAAIRLRWAWPSGRRAVIVGVPALLLLIGSGMLGWRLVSGEAAGAASVSVRATAYRVGIAALRERPVLGFGEKGYVREARRLEPRMAGDGHLQQPSARGISAHSSMMQIAVERGLLGLAAFLVLLGSVMRAGWAATASAEPADRAVEIGLFIGLGAFIVQAFTENLFDYSKTAALFWVMAGILVSFAVDRRAPTTVSAVP